MEIERTFEIAWPERRRVKESKMRVWAEDAIANSEIDGPSTLSVDELANQLHDAGLITLCMAREER